jgi:hypothetical protein
MSLIHVVLSQLTVSAWLYRCFNIPDALHGHPILVVAVDVLILEFTDFIEKNTQFVGNVRNVFVACLTPEREL